MCGDFGLSQDSDGVAEVIAPFCKRYGCDDCVPVLRRRLQRRIREGRPNKFLTLSLVRIEGGDPIEAARQLMHAWDVLLKLMRRYKGGHDIEFIHVKEGTKNGWPHLHIALRMKSIDHTVIREWWYRLTGANQIWIKAVTSQKGFAKYLAKYLTKDLVKFGTYRVWSSSRGWTVAPEEQPERVRGEPGQRPARIESGIKQHLRMLESAGYYIVWMSLRSWRAYGPHDWPEYAYRERSRRRANKTGYEEKLTWHF